MGNKYIFVVGLVLLVALVGSIYFFSDEAPAVNLENGFLTISSATDVPTVITESAREVSEGWGEYRSDRYSFSVLYPQDLSVQEFDEGGGASTITFQNAETAHGFQIFILPYNEPQVTDARFRMDVPSGVREQLTNVQVDGTVGAAFYSENAMLGETKEVWFTRGGYLYEVTTLKSLDTWLAQILESWKFI